MWAAQLRNALDRFGRRFLAEGNSPSAAIVDPRLSDGVCTAVAQHLVNCDIPFILYSGETESASELEPAFAEGHLLMKPASPEQLVEAVETALYGSDRRRKSGT